MKQRKISQWLKGIVISLAILGTVFVIAVTIFSFLKTEMHPVGSIIGFPFFTWYTIAVCYAILFQFWKVCKEIGNENSFSNENASAFHKMAIGGILLAIGFSTKFCLIFFFGNLGFVYGLFIVFEVIASIIFIVLCEALSKLVLHAYEMRQENELTI